MWKRGGMISGVLLKLNEMKGWQLKGSWRFLKFVLGIFNGLLPGEVANFMTDYFLSNIKLLAKCNREPTTKFSILPNGC